MSGWIALIRNAIEGDINYQRCQGVLASNWGVKISVWFLVKCAVRLQTNL